MGRILPAILLTVAIALLGGCCDDDSSTPTYTRWIAVFNDTQADIEVVWHHVEASWPCNEWTEERTSIHPGQWKRIDLTEQGREMEYAVWHFVAWQAGIDGQMDVRWTDQDIHVRPDNFRPHVAN
jgi:hypothetical protein